MMTRENQLAGMSSDSVRSTDGSLQLKRKPGEKVDEKWEELLEGERYDEVISAMDQRREERHAGHAARMRKLQADDLEQQRRIKSMEKEETKNDGLPPGFAENPAIKQAIDSLTPIFGADRARAAVYSGAQMGWAPGAIAPQQPQQVDPYSEIGKNLFTPIAEAMGNTLADALKVKPPATDQAAAAPANAGVPNDETEFYKKRIATIEAENQFLSVLQSHKANVEGAADNPALTPKEKNMVGVEIKNLDDAIRWMDFQTRHDMAMFQMQEEAKLRWAKYDDEKTDARNRNRQVDDVIDLAKKNLPGAIEAGKAAARDFAANKGVGGGGGGGTFTGKKPGGRINSEHGEVVVNCAWCEQDNVIRFGTKAFDCEKCGKPNEIGPKEENDGDQGRGR